MTEPLRLMLPDACTEHFTIVLVTGHQLRTV